MAKTDFKDDILNSSMNGKRQYVMVNNPNGTVSLNDVTVYDQMGDDFGAKEANDIGKDINLASYVQIAGGTATAITLSNVTLVNGLIITFVVAANNNGAATTINGKALYKPGTTQAPTLTAGKAVTVWYNGTHFFIKASAEGNAVAGDVLAGKTFSNDDDTGLTGNMTNRGAVNQALAINGSYTIPEGYHNGSGKVSQSVTTKAAQTYTPGTANQTIAAGQYLSGVQTIAGNANLVAANIKQGVSIFGVAGNFTNDSDAVAGNLLSGKTAFVKGAKITGNIPSKGAATITPSTANQTIAAGQYLSGAQTIAGSANLTAGNIRSGVNIFGVVGTVVPGKKYATGTATISSTGKQFEYINSTANTVFRFIEVGSLAFKPSVIIAQGRVWDPGYGTFGGYRDTIAVYSDPYISVVRPTSEYSSSTFVKSDVKGAYRSDTGFCIPVSWDTYSGVTNYTNISWWAWE